MASAAEMKAKVATGVQNVNEAQASLQAAKAKVQEALTWWRQTSDNQTLMAAIASLQNVETEIETAITQSMSAIEQANTYAAPL